MTDLYKFLLSASPQTILRKFIQETEEILVSLQEQLEFLQEDLHKPRKTSVIVMNLIQDVNWLVQLQVSRNDFLDEYKATLLGRPDKSNSGSKTASMGLLEAFVHESRHPIASMQGLGRMIQSNDEYNLEPQMFIERFNRVLHILKTMCDQSKGVVEKK